MKAKRGIPRFRKSSRSNGVYRSGFEKSVADILREHKVDFKYENRTFDYLVQSRNWIVCDKCGPIKGHIVRKYLVDFELKNEIFLELKGRLTDKDRSKMLSVKKQHPEIDLRIVFQRDNLIKSRAARDNNIRYSDWAAKHKFPYCVGEIPEEWINEARAKKGTPKPTHVSAFEALGDYKSE